LFDFSADQGTGKWTCVNDGVMGGVSQGKHRIREGKLILDGNLSLANNGGFASVRSATGRLDLRDSDELLIRVRGDGRTYHVNLRVPNNRMAFSYRASFASKAGEWQEVRIPVNEFRATSFGLVLRNASPVDSQSVNSIGFMIADKKPGPFQLEIDWIKVFRRNTAN
jgi:monofunctional biosynthetic peptidoglycan transglycosylase